MASGTVEERSFTFSDGVTLLAGAYVEPYGPKRAWLVVEPACGPNRRAYPVRVAFDPGASRTPAAVSTTSHGDLVFEYASVGDAVQALAGLRVTK